MQKIKQSNFELMRIVSMLFIILYHVIYHGKTLENSSGIILLILQLILCITLVHVNSFVLITGYFQYNKHFSLKSFLKTFYAAYFYKIIIGVVLGILGIIDLTTVSIYNLLNPFYIPYWFVSCYLILYLLSPFFNILIKNMNQSTHRKLILVLILCFSIAPFLSNQIVGPNNGLTVIQFVILYFIGSYLAKYPITQNIHFKNYSKNKIQTIFLIGTIIFMLLNFITYNFGITLSDTTSGLLNYIGNIINENYFRYNFIFVLLQSICYFLWFSTLKIQSKIINFVSPLTLGIYLIHDNMYLQTRLYTWFGIEPTTPITSNKIIIKIFAITAIIFICCAIIEFIRQQIFKCIKKRKTYKRISNKLYNYINNF